MKPIVVTGDLVRDRYLYQAPTTPSSYHESSPTAVAREDRGGAWYLSELIKLACADGNPSIWVPSEKSAAGQAFSVLSKSPQLSDSGEKESVWGIATFLGCERPAASDTASPLLDPEGHAPPMVSGTLVIDDLGLGFNRAKALWPDLLDKEKDWRGQVILKTSSARGENLLLKHLLEGGFADRLMVIVSADSLRSRGAAISLGLSWDQALEDTEREFAEGRSTQDLARCRRVVVSFGLAGVMSFVRPKEVRHLATLERFLYHPDELEGDLERRRGEIATGAKSFLAAALTRHTIDPASYPIQVALGNALATARLAQQRGFVEASTPSDTPPHQADVRAMFARPRTSGGEEPAFSFSTALPRGDEEGRADLLADLTGMGPEFVAAKATEVVLRGTKEALRRAPKARYGSFETVDREEIERINTIRRLAEAYLANPKERRPLSIAVFGPPGSGKSFAIKQLAELLFGEKRDPLTFNLSGFGGQGLPQLHEAFHRVRDASVQGQVPLVFWDEFDSDGLDWLKHFLAPMQDAEFRAGSLVYPIGRALFVFAGGTRSSFGEFNPSPQDDKKRFEEFVAKKGPDFVSRLRGFIDIKGPNPIGGPEQDPAHLIRRAVLLRSLLERDYPDLIDPDTKLAAISPGVVRGFLRVEKYLHGARSLESLVQSSRLRSARYFESSQLPPPDLLSLYVTPDFTERVAEGEILLPVIEALARAEHEDWKTRRGKAGWSHGPKRDDANRVHDRLVPYDQLTEPQKEDNRFPARLLRAKLNEVGYTVRPKGPDDPKDNPTPKFPDEVRDRLFRIEHEIWMRDHRLRGYDRADQTDESLHLHRSFTEYDSVPEDRELLAANVDIIPKVLWEMGYVLEAVDRKREDAEQEPSAEAEAT